jgi:hypothetical protein
VTLQTGDPLTGTAGYDGSLTGLGDDRVSHSQKATHVNPSNPNTALNSAQFGKITGVGTPRVGQVAVKLTF